MGAMFEGVVAICTRGFTFTEVLDGVVKNIVPRIINGHYWTVRSTWDKPIPEAQNTAVQMSLAFDPDMIWFVEEDTVPPLGILTHMIQIGGDVVVADYNLERGKAVQLSHKEENRVLYGGIGCMLIKRRVINAFKMPYFELGRWSVTADEKFGRQGMHPPRYGSQDISFFVKLDEAGFKARYAGNEWRCRHLRLDELGERGTNNGLHKIREL